MYAAHSSARGRADFDFLETAREATGLASQGAGDVDHLLSLDVRDVHIEWPGGSAALSSAAVSVLLGLVHLLAEGVEDLVFVRGLEASESFQNLHLLFDEELVFPALLIPPWCPASSCFTSSMY